MQLATVKRLLHARDCDEARLIALALGRVEESESVAAGVLLDAVERMTRMAQQGLGIGRVGREQRSANTGGQLDGLVLTRRWQAARRAQNIEQTLQRVLSLLGIGGAQDQAELITSEPSDHIGPLGGGAQRAAQPL